MDDALIRSLRVLPASWTSTAGLSQGRGVNSGLAVTHLTEVFAAPRAHQDFHLAWGAAVLEGACSLFCCAPAFSHWPRGNGAAPPRPPPKRPNKANDDSASDSSIPGFSTGTRKVADEDSNLITYYSLRVSFRFAVTGQSAADGNYPHVPRHYLKTVVFHRGQTHSMHVCGTAYTVCVLSYVS